MLSVVNGLGAATNFTHKPITDTSIYTKGSSATFPDVDIQPALYVTSSVKTDNGVSGQNTTSYAYTGARAHAEGRGFLGFATLEATDSVTGNYTKTTYSQAFPYIGQVTATEQRQSDAKLISNTAVTLASSNPETDTYFPYADVSTTTKYEIDAVAVTEVKTDTDYDSNGNATQVKVTTTDKTTGTPTAGDVFETLTTNTYHDDTTNWLLGRLICAKVKKTLPDTSNETRVSGFEYSSTTGIMTKEVIEPKTGSLTEPSGVADCVTASSDTNITLITAYTLDAFGNRTEVTVSGDAITSRTTTTTWGERTGDGDSNITDNGRFAVKVENALEHAEERTYDGEFGTMTKLKGPNDLDTTWTYDDFGRVLVETRADGTTTTTTRADCVSDCPSSATLSLKTAVTGQPTVVVYTDELGREIRTETIGFPGDAVFVDTSYDVLGRVRTKTRPYYAGNTKVKTTLTYDVLSRPIKESKPGPDGETIDTEIMYDRLEVTSDNALGQYNVKVNNAIGELIETVQALGETEETGVAYTYDPFGNLLTTTDESSNEVSNTYDVRGRKLTMTDPDMGDWTYAYNALGELIEQTDELGQVTEMDYDLLGRMTKRRDEAGTGSEVESEWIYDTSPTKGKGKLYQVKQNEVLERTFTYDVKGRPDEETHKVDSTEYTVKTEYDSSGRVETVTYPASTHHGTGYKVRYFYNTWGFLDKVEDTATTPVVYWEAQAQDAEGHLSDFDLGNDLRTVRAYNAYTGLLGMVDTGTATTLFTGNSTQQDEYVFDALGNLTLRRDYNQTVQSVALQEDFTYDNLNRLVTSQVLGESQKTYAYDALGNLTSKAGVSYTYGQNGAGPHAVTTAGSDTFVYDGNGNQTTKNSTDRVITYSPYNKPLSIAANGDTVTFTYGADRGRIKQVSNGGNDSIVYVAAAAARFEKQTIGSTYTADLHYIAAGGEVVAIYKSIDDDGSTSEETRYLHRDHLGSIAKITSDTGSLVETLSYDAWGKRRHSTWVDYDPDADPPETPPGSAETHRGFTGHEMLDSVGLVHMNGRVYDPELGRFLSADPFVQFPENSQSLNRYSYVLNNPLSFTDPSGFFLGGFFDAIGDLVGGIGDVISSVANAIFDNIGPILQIALPTIACVGNFACAVGVASATSAGITLATGGSLGDALLSATFTAAAAVAFHGVGDFFGPVEFGTFDHLAKVAAHGVVGGAFSELRGGKFLNGFLAAGFFEAAAPGLSQRIESRGARVAAAAIIGGTAAKLGGGKFANGAKTFGFLRLYSEASAYYEEVVGKRASLRPGTEVTRSPTGEIDGSYVPDPVTGQIPCINECAVSGFNASIVGSRWHPRNWFRQAGPGGLILNYVPLGAPASRFHDTLWNPTTAQSHFNAFTNVATMPPAAIISAGAIVGNFTRVIDSSSYAQFLILNEVTRIDR